VNSNDRAIERARSATSGHRAESLTDGDEWGVWRFSNPETWVYGFYVAFAPGHVFVGGDIGEMVVTHYGAAKTMQEALNWLISDRPDLDYLLGKSNKEEVIDMRATLEFVKSERKNYVDDGDPDEPTLRGFDQLIEDIPATEPTEVPRMIYDSGLFDGYAWYGSMSFDSTARFQMACLLQAAEAIREEIL